MKGLLGLLALALVFAGIGIWWTQTQMSEDPGEYIALAFDKPKGDSIQIDVLVTLAMPRREPPQVDRKTGTVYWQKWVDEHFDIRDPDGEKVFLRRMNFSQLISEREARTTPECYVTGKLRPGVHYTFDYIPFRIGTLKYRYEFTAPTAEVRTRRQLFEPLEP